jgi:hypothetical protein
MLDIRTSATILTAFLCSNKVLKQFESVEQLEEELERVAKVVGGEEALGLAGRRFELPR